MIANEQVKIKLVYKDDEDVIQTESIWAEKISNDHYRVLNIPFFAPNLAFHDIISAEEDEEVLYFDELITPSGHTTIQMIIYNGEEVMKIGEELVMLGCNWEGSHLKGYISIDVPATLPYAPVKKYLRDGFLQKRWDYKEACLAHSSS